MMRDFPHLKLSEVACHDGTPYPEEFADRWETLGGLFEKYRTKYGDAIYVVSGYRSPKHNKALIRKDKERGSHQVASGSQHIEGRALDVRCKKRTDLPILFRIMMAMHENGETPELGGIAIYPLSDWIHFDTFIAPDGHLRKWKGN